MTDGRGRGRELGARAGRGAAGRVDQAVRSANSAGRCGRSARHPSMAGRLAVGAPDHDTTGSPRSRTARCWPMHRASGLGRGAGPVTWTLASARSMAPGPTKPPRAAFCREATWRVGVTTRPDARGQRRRGRQDTTGERRRRRLGPLRGRPPALGPLRCGRSAARRRDRVILQHRAPWTHEGDTWGVPGGRATATRTPLAAALREAGEESVARPRRRRPDRPNWSTTTAAGPTPPWSRRAAGDAGRRTRRTPRARGPLVADRRGRRRCRCTTGFAAAWPASCAPACSRRSRADRDRLAAVHDAATTAAVASGARASAAALERGQDRRGARPPAAPTASATGPLGPPPTAAARRARPARRAATRALRRARPCCCPPASPTQALRRRHRRATPDDARAAPLQRRRLRRAGHRRD